MRTRYLRGPLLAGAAVVLAAGVISATVLAVGSSRKAGVPASPADVAATPLPPIAARAILTANLYAAPDRGAEVVGVVPEKRMAEVTGRLGDSSWLRVAYPPGTNLGGWIPAERVAVERGAVEDAPTVVRAGGEGAPAGGEGEGADDRPDLVLSNVFVAPGGTLTARIANAGNGEFVGGFGLRVTSAEGEILGVLDIQETSLDSGRSATVNTQILIERTGTYLIEVDWLDEIDEASEFNNTLRTLLVPGR